MPLTCCNRADQQLNTLLLSFVDEFIRCIVQLDVTRLSKWLCAAWLSPLCTVCDSLNAQAHHGDWFGGKAVGLAVLNIGSLTANVYVTHVRIFTTSAIDRGP